MGHDRLSEFLQPAEGGGREKKIHQCCCFIVFNRGTSYIFYDLATTVQVFLFRRCFVNPITTF